MFGLMSDIDWNKIPEKKRTAFAQKLYTEADKVKRADYTKPARTNLPVKLKFYAVRMLHTSIGKTNPGLLVLIFKNIRQLIV